VVKSSVRIEDPKAVSRVSIIMPTLNEGACLERSLRCLSILRPAVKEIIVVDAGSCDDTVAIAKAAGAKVIFSEWARRSVQMNLGAQQAQGEILCFLHGDTLVPDDLVSVIRAVLSDRSTVAGGFISLMTGETTRWSTSIHNALKTYYAPLLFRPWLFFSRNLRILFGDQVIFCRKTDFDDCGGFDSSLSIMEDADFCIRLSAKGRIRQVKRVVFSSDRRVAKWGTLKANFIYFAIGALWGIGVSDKALKQFYEDIR